MKVLLATDGSIEAELAETVLTKLPLKDPFVTVATIVSSPAPMVMSPGLLYDFDDGSLERLQHEVADRTVEFISDRLMGMGYHVETQVAQGDVANRLLEIANQKKTDLVAVGSRIEGSLKAAFLGSVSRKLALYCGSSVLVAHHYRQRPTEGSIDRLQAKEKLDVLLAVDGTPGSTVAIDALSAINQPRFNRVTTITVAESGRKKAEAEARANQVAECASAKLKCADSIDFVVASGRPSAAIGRIAESGSYDLVVMGTSQHGPFERLIVGSCANETITNAPCSVLLVRGGLALA